MKRIFQQSYRLMSGRMLAVLAGLALAGSAQATDPLFQNNSFLNFTVPGNPPPVYDVTAFDNENVFIVNYSIYYPSVVLYETLNTVYYTNNGTMVVNTPTVTNGFLSGFGSGFLFDKQTNGVNSRSMAGTFYNPGTIRCNSTNDGNGIFNFFGFTFFINSVGQCTVNATNIINSGSVIAGPNGQIKLTCQNADLSYGTLALEQPLTAGNLFNGFFTTAQSPANISASGAFGTGFGWIPNANLGATFATSSIPNQISLSNSTPYVRIANIGPTNRIVRAVFIVNNSPSVPYRVYIGNPADPTLGPGTATIEWDGVYQDPATCNYYTNYLYLNDFYELVATTNIFINNGIPNNFTFTESSTPKNVGLTPETPTFLNVFQPTTPISPQYAYVTAQLLSSSVATNASGINPSGALTNLPGKILITASNDLNLANVQITGDNYLQLIAPNQFDGSENSHIEAPYSDINLGVTNGRLNLANLIAGGVTTLSGGLQAWSGEWVDANTNTGIFTDFRVLIVSSQLAPLSQAWIQSLRLHATNSLVINDVMNVFKTLTIDAQRLTLATNACGNGFTSFDGELNWYNSLTFGPTHIPNVLWLTNNGAIRALSDAIFGTSGLRYAAFINRGLIADNGTTIWTTNFVNGGTITNGSGGFTLSAQTAVMTNGAVYANGNVSLTTTSLLISNEVIRAGRSLTLMATNFLSDGVVSAGSFCGAVSNGNIWTVGALAINGDGLSLPVKPALGDLLGTTITNIAPGNKGIVDLWSGLDRGASVTGFSNNAAIGHLVLDALGSAPLNGRFTFNGADVISGNAIYVDEIEFRDYSTNKDANFNMQGITFNPNLVIYFAQAIINNQSVAEKLDKKNTNGAATHFRWVPSYAGIFSGTNLVYPDGTTNCVNAALAQSTSIDSDGDGIPNATDPTPFFVASQINFNLTVTNIPPRFARLTWMTPTGGTNTVYYKTNLLSPTWLVLTNFASPQIYPAPPTTVKVLDPVGANVTRFYRVSVLPWLTYPN